MCREHGQQLKELAAKGTQPLEGFGLFGLVKETGVDDEGLVDFYEKFPFPLYRDEGLVFYKDFFGDSKLGFSTFNPFALYRGYKNMMGRLNEKGLEGNMKGEGMVQGGIIVFGKDGEVKYAYREETGSPLPENDLLAALEAVRDERSEL